jgi:hypothetical protein
MTKPLIVPAPVIASVPTCPTCGAPIGAQAIIEAWEPGSGWQFYGEPGARSIRRGCDNYHELPDGRLVASRHFIVEFVGQDGRAVKQHRLAWIIGKEIE